MGEAEGRLDSWKEIAAYLKRDVTTVQRWERREGMPVHRHLHDKLGSVYAYRSQLDAWARSRNVGTARDPRSPGNPAGQASSTPAVSTRSGASWALVLGAAVLALMLGGMYAWLRANTEVFWRSPLTDVELKRVTDGGGTGQAAAISRDGRYIAYLSDGDGHMDVWVTQVGTGRFRNLTQGRFLELVNDQIRAIGFSPDGTLVTFWTRHPDRSVDVWAAPLLGGDPQPYLKGAAEFDWSSDGSRLVYHTAAAGDPTFLRAPAAGSEDQPLLKVAAGLHAHFPVWSPDRAFIYFVQAEIGAGSDVRNADVWRIRTSGGQPERITHHNSRVTHPVLLDDRTLLYLATDGDGSGPWLYSADVERRVPHRLSPTVDAYTSLAASADGRHLVLTVARPKGTLWRSPVADRPVDASQGAPISLTTGRGFAPRLGSDYLVYVSSTGSGDGVWRVGSARGDTATSLWTAAGSRIVGGPALDSTGARIAFSVKQQDKTLLYVMNADGTEARSVTAALSLVGSPAWQPDGKAVISSATVNGTPRLFRIALDGTAVPLADEYALDPVWSHDGRFVVYSGPDVGTSFSLKAFTAAGAPYALPNLTLTRGARRVRFIDEGHALVVMRGNLKHKDLWAIDLDTGNERQLTSLPPDFDIEDFDISGDGRDIVLERVQAQSEVLLLSARGR